MSQTLPESTFEPNGHDEAQARHLKKVLEQQRNEAMAIIDSAMTMAEEVAAWAGKQRGADRDEAIQTAFRVIAGLGDIPRAQYRSRLADLMGLGLREYDQILKASGKDSGDKPMAFVEVFGGYIEGWLLEYLYDPKSKKARLAYRDPDGKVGTADHIDIGGVRYIPKTPTSFIMNGGVLFPSDLGGLRGTRELVQMVEAFIHEHYLVDPRYLGRIMAYYVMLTWVYDSFNALCYLRAVGEAGAGKSELMKRVGYMCYRMMTANGAGSSASFFRTVEQFKGTLFIDEADLHDGGDTSNAIVKFINLGAMKGNPIWRQEEIMGADGTKKFETVANDTFCPKLIAMRKEFKDDAVGSRSLTIRLMPKDPIELRERGIKLFIDNTFKNRALQIRNLLLRWRLAHWQPEIEVLDEHMDVEISSRLNQVTMPLKALAAGDGELTGEIEKFLRAYNMEMVLDRSMTIAARVVEAMWKIYRYPDLRAKYLHVNKEGEEYIYIGDIAVIANEILDEMNKTDDDDENEKKLKKDSIKPKSIGTILRQVLQIHVGQRHGVGFPAFWDEIKMIAHSKRYGVDVSALPALPDKTLAAVLPPEPKLEPVQARFDDVDFVPDEPDFPVDWDSEQ